MHIFNRNQPRQADMEKRKAQLERNKHMKADLTRANFSLGDEKVDYDTTSRASVRAGAAGT